MTPVDQTIFGCPNGNCFAACIASILNLPLEIVPNFVVHEEKWFEAATDWCQRLGYSLLWVKRDAVVCGYIDPRPLIDAGHYFIVTGKSPRGDFNHCIVQHRDETAHDPHPSRAGIVGLWEDFILIIPNSLAA